MKPYHKINALYMRTKQGAFVPGEFATPELGVLYREQYPFYATEKIDGTNIRVNYVSKGDSQEIVFGGRTARAQIPAHLQAHLDRVFTVERFQQAFEGDVDITLYGEGYGQKIQGKQGEHYAARDHLADGVGFRLFDVMIGGLYLERYNVEDVAFKMGIGVVPRLGAKSLRQWEMIVGQWATSGDMREGVVCTPVADLYTRTGERIITKIKKVDYGN